MASKHPSPLEKASFRTPYSAVLKLGSGYGHGTAHFIAQRVTSLAAIPLSLIIIYMAYKGFFAPYEQALALIRKPFFSISSFLFTGVALYHMKLGMTVVVTDYVHHAFVRMISLILNIFFCSLVGVIITYALLKINFGPLA